MDLASDRPTRDHSEPKFSDPPIGYINVRRREVRHRPLVVNVNQSDDDDDSSVDEEPRERTTTQGKLITITISSFQFRRHHYPISAAHASPCRQPSIGWCP
jgi:hypothetical protein